MDAKTIRRIELKGGECYPPQWIEYGPKGIPIKGNYTFSLEPSERFITVFKNGDKIKSINMDIVAEITYLK